MSAFQGVVQINNVWPGSFGGAIFSAHPINSRKVVICKLSYKAMITLPKKGEFWLVHGKASFDKSSFKTKVLVSKCQLQALPSNQFLSAYLEKSPRFRGFNLGPKKIKKLIDKVGNESLLIDLMEQNKWTHIADVINEKTAKRLCKEWIKSKNETDTVAFLVEHDFDPQLCQKIMKLCRENTVTRLKDNPYNLLAFGGIVRNIFSVVEKCAEKLNISRDDPRRLVGGIEHVMYERLKVGHTAIEERELLEQVIKLLGSKVRAKNAIQGALKTQAICKLIENKDTFYQAIGPAYIEHCFENRLARLINEEEQKPLFAESELSIKEFINIYNKRLIATEGYSLAKGQTDAILMALTNRCSIITGFGGTGKTTVLKAIVDIAKTLGNEVYLMALAGKAKERIKHATGHDAMTIHSFINAALAKTKESESQRKLIDLDCDPIIVIDEASMVDVSLFNKLLKLFDNRSYRLLTVGDQVQLSPVGFGLAWHKMVESMIPTTHLTEVHRQKYESSLNQIAMQIREGRSDSLPNWNGEREGIYFVESGKANLLDEIVNIKNKLKNAQVLTPHMTERLTDSATSLNNELQAKLHFTLEDGWKDNRSGLRIGRHFIKEGDPVLVTENNYDVDLFNGTLGKLVNITTNEEEESIGIFEFEGVNGTITLNHEQCYEIGLVLAYAITIHKSQGSEFDETIISCIIQSNFVERSMLYTALTRTKKLCIIVGDRKVYHSAVASLQRSDTLCTGLKINSKNSMFA